MKYMQFFSFLTVCLLALLLNGCATQVVEEPSPVKPSSIKFKEFQNVVLVKSELAKSYSGQSANVKAAKKIDENLKASIKQTFPNLVFVENATEKNSALETFQTGEKTLVIEPKIKQIKFIGGAARFWAGAMAGSSVVVMDVQFTDAASDKVIANPGFFRKAGAYSDNFGISSNLMLTDVAKDAYNYILANY